MTRHSLRSRLLLGLLALLAAPRSAHAGFTKNLIARIDTIRYEPDKGNATRVVFEGWFRRKDTSDPSQFFVFEAPQRGLVYYQCNAGGEAKCRAEWDFIERYDTACIGLPDATVHAPGAQPVAPDLYDIFVDGKQSVPDDKLCQPLATLPSSEDGGTAQGDAGVGADARSPRPDVLQADTANADADNRSGGASGGGCAVGSATSSQPCLPLPLLLLLLLLLLAIVAHALRRQNLWKRRRGRS
ncbi:MAG: hypothetical protein KC503_39325 [Myxococcales bacterium]|nr:hypothetical protein [Myxococcales bacterium]